jgi:hypothetical protein
MSVDSLILIQNSGYYGRILQEIQRRNKKTPKVAPGHAGTAFSFPARHKKKREAVRKTTSR